MSVAWLPCAECGKKSEPDNKAAAMATIMFTCKCGGRISRQSSHVFTSSAQMWDEFVIDRDEVTLDDGDTALPATLSSTLQPQPLSDGTRSN